LNAVIAVGLFCFVPLPALLAAFPTVHIYCQCDIDVDVQRIFKGKIIDVLLLVSYVSTPIDLSLEATKFSKQMHHSCLTARQCHCHWQLVTALPVSEPLCTQIYRKCRLQLRERRHSVSQPDSHMLQVRVFVNSRDEPVTLEWDY